MLGELQYLTSISSNATTRFMTINRFSTSTYCHLLSFQSSRHQSFTNAVIEEICCVGALFYLKTIYDFHLGQLIGGLPAGAWTDPAMIQKLKSCLDMGDMNTPQTRGLFLWILFLGGTAVAGTRNRAWFVARLAKAIMDFQICGWEDAKSSLMKFLWIDGIHEHSCRDLWEEALVTVDVLFGSSTPIPQSAIYSGTNHPRLTLGLASSLELSGQPEQPLSSH